MDLAMQYEKEGEVARSLAIAAGDIQVSAQQEDLAVAQKDDRSPVTAIDRRCEALIRSGLQTAFPGDGILGEEEGHREGTSGRTWIVDPVDGTRPFIRGIPTYACLIALEDGGEPVVGVIHLAGLGETYWASLGAGAFRNGEAIRVSSIRRLRDATGSGFGHVHQMDTPLGKRLLKQMGEWDYAYGFMDNYTYACIAAGRLDLCVNLLDKPWDCAAAACIVSEAGGAYSDIAGNKTIYQGTIVLSNGLLHDEILARFNDPRD